MAIRSASSMRREGGGPAPDSRSKPDAFRSRRRAMTAVFVAGSAALVMTPVARTDDGIHYYLSLGDSPAAGTNSTGLESWGDPRRAEGGCGPGRPDRGHDLLRRVRPALRVESIARVRLRRVDALNRLLADA